FGALAMWVTLTRALGQSALSVVSLTIIGQWFVQKIDAAMAVFSIVMSIGFMIAFPTVGGLVQSRGGRFPGFAAGIALIVALAPLAWAVVRRGTEASGQPVDTTGYRWTEALRTPTFWIFAIGTSLYGLVASGIGLFNESILAQRGFGPEIYYQTLVVTALTALIGNFGGGWLATRVQLGTLMAIALMVL